MPAIGGFTNFAQYPGRVYPIPYPGLINTSGGFIRRVLIMHDDGFHGITIALLVMAILWFSRVFPEESPDE